MASVLLLLIGFILLIKGADFFVDGSSAIAKTFRIPPVIIGLTIVALGTSAPEAAVSIQAALNQNNAISVSNVIGSNLFNLLMVIGCCAVLKKMNVDKSVLRRDFPICILATALTACFLWDRTLSRMEGMILLLLFIVYLTVIVTVAIKNKDASEDSIKSLPIWLSLIYIAIGLVGIVWGGDLVVDNASRIAERLGMSSTLIGLTIVALGTSLPELVTSLVASAKGSSDLAIGNVIGSNICNILFVLAASASISPMRKISADSLVDSLVCLGVTVLMYLMCFRKKQFNRAQGAFCIVIYLVYTAYILMRNYNLLPF